MITDFLSTITTFYNLYLPTLQFASVVLSLVLFAAILYLATKVNYFHQITDQWFDTLTIGASGLTQRRSLRAWKLILKLLRSPDPDKWRRALQDADDILGEILKEAGYLGDNLDERLENMTAAQLADIEELRSAHDLTKKANSDTDHPLRKEEADEAIYVYRKVFIDLRLLRD